MCHSSLLERVLQIIEICELLSRVECPTKCMSCKVANEKPRVLEIENQWSGMWRVMSMDRAPEKRACSVWNAELKGVIGCSQRELQAARQSGERMIAEREGKRRREQRHETSKKAIANRFRGHVRKDLQNL